MCKMLSWGMTLVLAAAVAACATDSAVGPEDNLRPSLAVTFDPATGLGFVGKGDVQLVFGWNNKQLQDNAALVDFRVSSISEQVTTWTCSKPHPQGHDDIVDMRANTTTTTLQGLVTTVARENSKGRDGPVSGFHINGYEGAPTSSQLTSGDQLGSCPSSQSGFTHDNNESTTTNELGGGVQVTNNGSDWYNIPAPLP